MVDTQRTTFVANRLPGRNQLVMQEAVGVDDPGRTWSLRREWSRAFTIMLMLLLLASVATFAGVRQLVGHFSHSAGQLDASATCDDR